MDEFDVVPGKTGGAEIVMSKKLPAPGDFKSNPESERGGASQQEA
jgi:hypothetical protein